MSCRFYEVIAGFPGYTVDREGNVWSKGRRLKGSTNKKGHRSVQLSAGGVSRSLYVHRLVLAAFVGPCPQGMEGCHKDGNPANNHIDNLYWGTPEQNVRDAMRHGTIGKCRGSGRGQSVGKGVRRDGNWVCGTRKHNAKLTEADIAEVFRLASEGVYQRVIAERFGVRQPTINVILKGKAWRHAAPATLPGP